MPLPKHIEDYFIQAPEDSFVDKFLRILVKEKVPKTFALTLTSSGVNLEHGTNPDGAFRNHAELHALFSGRKTLTVSRMLKIQLAPLGFAVECYDTDRKSYIVMSYIGEKASLAFLGDLIEKVDEMYYAPEMPGYIKAKESFKGRV